MKTIIFLILIAFTVNALAYDDLISEFKSHGVYLSKSIRISFNGKTIKTNWYPMEKKILNKDCIEILNDKAPCPELYIHCGDFTIIEEYRR